MATKRGEGVMDTAGCNLHPHRKKFEPCWTFKPCNILNETVSIEDSSHVNVNLFGYSFFRTFTINYQSSVLSPPSPWPPAARLLGGALLQLRGAPDGHPRHLLPPDVRRGGLCRRHGGPPRGQPGEWTTAE